jgi:hypothetical protein
MASKLLNASHKPRMPCSSIEDVYYLLQLSSESSRSIEVPTLQMQVNGAGNGMQERRYGCHIGQIYQMQVMDAHFYSTVGVWLHARVTANVIKLEFAVIHCASVKGTV